MPWAFFTLQLKLQYIKQYKTFFGGFFCTFSFKIGQLIVHSSKLEQYYHHKFILAGCSICAAGLIWIEGLWIKMPSAVPIITPPEAILWYYYISYYQNKNWLDLILLTNVINEMSNGFGSTEDQKPWAALIDSFFPLGGSRLS